MKSFLFLLSMILLVNFFFLNAQTKSKVEQTKHFEVTEFNPARNPAVDLKAAVKEAEKSNKRILLDVGGKWCIWCRRLDKFFETHKDVKEYLEKNYVEMKVNYGPKNQNYDFLSHYPKIPGFPHIFILDKHGKLLCSEDTGKLENGKGGHDYHKVFKFLKKWAPKNKS